MSSLFHNTIPVNRYIPRHKKPEESVHRQVVQYLRLQYPNVLFRTDGGGLFLTKTQAGVYKSLNKTSGWPDLFIAKANGKYHGLFIELKKDNTSIYLKRGENKGSIVANQHIQNQALVLKQLESLGYCARFGIGFNHTKAIIDAYMGQPPEPENAEMF